MVPEQAAELIPELGRETVRVPELTKELVKEQFLQLAKVLVTGGTCVQVVLF